MPGQHCGHQTQRVCQWTHDEVGDDLQRDQQWKNPARNTFRHYGKLQVANPKTAQTYGDPDDIGNDCDGICCARVRERWQLQNWDCAEQVIEKYKEKDCKQQWNPLPEVFFADNVSADTVTYERVTRFGDPL